MPSAGAAGPRRSALIEFLLGPDARFFCGSLVFCDGGTDAMIRADDIPPPWHPSLWDWRSGTDYMGDDYTGVGVTNAGAVSSAVVMSTRLAMNSSWSSVASPGSSSMIRARSATCSVIKNAGAKERTFSKHPLGRWGERWSGSR